MTTSQARVLNSSVPTGGFTSWLEVDRHGIRACEAYLQKGDVGKAKEQLMEIADRRGGPCDDYELLVKAIAAHVTGKKIIDW